MVDRADVTCVLVTRGDVDLAPVRSGLIFDDVRVWDNRVLDFGAYGRYLAASAEAGSTTRPVIYTQDDDCTVEPEAQEALLDHYEQGVVVSNMNPDHNVRKPYLALPGWGCLFDRDLITPTFALWALHEPYDFDSDRFRRVGCDIVFPVLNRSKMVDLGHENLPWAWAANRTHVQPGYQEAKDWYYERASELRWQRVDEAA